MRSSAALLKKRARAYLHHPPALPLHLSTLYELSLTKDSPQSDFLIPKQANGQASKIPRSSKRFVVRADELLTAFLELESAIHPQPGSSQRPTAQAAPDAQLSAPGIAPPHAEGDGLSGVTSDGELYGFISGPACFVGGVPVTRARNPWANAGSIALQACIPFCRCGVNGENGIMGRA
jgi:hypothetical protein